jgi:hypothetical protein
MFTSLHIRLSRLRLESNTKMARNRHLGIRLTDDELARIVAMASASEGRRPAAWLRELALRSPASVPAPETASHLASSHFTRPVSTRFSTEQYEHIRERAHACGLSVAAYARLAVLGATPVLRRGGDIRPAIAALNRVGNNLNQLTKLANQGMPFPAELAAAVSRVLAEVRRMRDTLLEVDE